MIPESPNKSTVKSQGKTLGKTGKQVTPLKQLMYDAEKPWLQFFEENDPKRKRDFEAYMSEAADSVKKIARSTQIPNHSALNQSQTMNAETDADSIVNTKPTSIVKLPSNFLASVDSSFPYPTADYKQRF